MSTESKPVFAAWAVVVAVLSASILLPLLFHASSLVQVRLLSAVVPALIILHLFIRSDLFPEPPQVILMTFALGIVVIVPVVLVELVVIRLLGGFDAWGPLAPVLLATLGAAIPEETAKFLILTRYCARHSAFDEPMDGLVYGVTASLGFAALENVFYVFNEPAYAASLGIAGIRAVTAVPSHAVDGAVMGFFIGLRYALPARRRQLTRAAWGVPVVLHALYDLAALTGIPLLWLWVVVVQLGIASSILAKLRAIQEGRDHAEAVVQWAWDATRRRLRLRPRALPPPEFVERDRDVADTDDDPPPSSAPADPTCPRCDSALAACICAPGTA
jgi:RsiW-degrading membrane proteinase PrsW (M82 family)